MNTLETTQYAKTWDALFNALEALRVEMPDIEQEIDNVKDEVKKAREKPYTIAVCGEIKAGKSTLLNALFFKKNVLPSFVTPLTAKLTFIHYTDDTPYFEVEFLSKQEFESIRTSAQNDPGESKKLNKRLEICQSHGVSHQNYIGHEKIKLIGLDLLKQYVSDPASASIDEDEPIYTPMVKCVHIYINHEALKKVTIVDTPGLNDPNPINSKETSKWIDNANAVLYVLSVEGVDIKDTEFFEQTSLESAQNARIFVQNKIDQDADYSTAKQQIYDYGQQELYKRKGLFLPSETICSYSALGVLAKAKKAAGDELDDDEFNCLQDLEGRSADPDNLMEKLSEKLCNNEGEVRISEAVGRIRSLYLNACTEIEKKTADKQTKLKMLEDGIEQAQQDINHLREFKTELKKTEDKYYDKCEQIAEDAKNEISNVLDDAKDNVYRQMNAAIMAADRSCYDLANLTSSRFTSLCQKYFTRELKKESSQICKMIKEELTNIREEIKKEALKFEIPSTYYPIRIRIEEYIDRNLYRVTNIDTNQLYNDMPDWWDRFFENANPKRTALSRIEDTLNNYVDETCEQFNGAFDAITHEAFEMIIKEWRDNCDEKEQALQDVKNSYKNDQVGKETLERELKELDEVKTSLLQRLELFDKQFRI